MIKKIMVLSLVLTMAMAGVAFAYWEETLTDLDSLDTLVLKDASASSGSQTQFTSLDSLLDWVSSELDYVNLQSDVTNVTARVNTAENNIDDLDLDININTANINSNTSDIYGNAVAISNIDAVTMDMPSSSGQYPQFSGDGTLIAISDYDLRTDLGVPTTTSLQDATFAGNFSSLRIDGVDVGIGGTVEEISPTVDGLLGFDASEGTWKPITLGSGLVLNTTTWTLSATGGGTTYSLTTTIDDNSLGGDFSIRGTLYGADDSPISITGITNDSTITYSGSNEANCTGGVTGSTGGPWTATTSTGDATVACVESVASGGGGPEEAFVEDNFSEVADTTLDLHTPDIGNSWLGDASSFSVVSTGNEVTVSTDDEMIAYNNVVPSSSDYTLTTTGTVNDVYWQRQFGAVGRWTPASGGYMCRVRGDGHALIDGIDSSKAVTTLIDQTMSSYDSATEYKIVFDLVGTSLSCGIYDGATLLHTLSTTDSTYTSGYAGVLSRGNFSQKSTYFKAEY